MKNLKKYKLITLLLALILITSCIKDDDFDTPDISIIEPNIENVIGMNAIANQLLNNNLSNFFINEYIDIFDDRNDVIPITFESTNNHIQGYVISSDEAGNFFEEIIIQDKLENPTYGIKINIDANPLFTQYQLGQKIYIKLDGLSLNISNGVLTLGILNSNGRLEKIAESQLKEYIIPATEIGVIVPKQINLIDSDALVLDTNQFVRFDNMQFHRNGIFTDETGNPKPLSFANEPSDEFDGERLLESCDFGRIILSTSTFSDFKSLKLPVNKGSIQGVLTRNFFGDTLNLNINSPNDINFNASNRCDPFMCNSISGGGNAFFEENFENFNGYINEGWTNINVSNGSVDWVVGDYQGNTYAQISGFNSSEIDIQAWLVTPTINMENTTGEELKFDIQVNYDNGNILTVMASSNFTGDVTTADWVDLGVDIPSGPSGGFGTFTSVAPTNISCLDGNINIAFVYKGSDPGATTRYHVDNVQITGN